MLSHHYEKAEQLLNWIDDLDRGEKPDDEVLVVAILAVAHAVLATVELPDA